MAVNPVKVVIINTQYVETDAMSFKSVVQRLTGKDSTVAFDSFATKETTAFRDEPNTKADQTMTYPVLASGLSFRDTNGMLIELPPLDDLYRQLYDEPNTKADQTMSYPVLARGLSFRDIDRMLNELPPPLDVSTGSF